MALEENLLQYGLAGAALVFMFRMYTMQHNMFRETIKAIDKLSDAINNLSREISTMKEDINMIKSDRYNEQLLKNLLKWEKGGGRYE